MPEFCVSLHKLPRIQLRLGHFPNGRIVYIPNPRRSGFRELYRFPLGKCLFGCIEPLEGYSAEGKGRFLFLENNNSSQNDILHLMEVMISQNPTALFHHHMNLKSLQKLTALFHLGTNSLNGQSKFSIKHNFSTKLRTTCYTLLKMPSRESRVCWVSNAYNNAYSQLIPTP